MSESPFRRDADEGDEPGGWVEHMMEAMLITKTLGAGGLMRVTHDQVREAAERAQKWFPNGMHAHWESSSAEGFKLELLDGARCDKHDQHDGDGVKGAGHVDPRGIGSHEWGPSLMAEMNEDGTINPKTLNKDDLERVNYAQHVILCALLARLGEKTATVTKEEYEAATNIATKGIGALILSRRGETYSVSMVDDVAVGGGRVGQA